MTLAKVRVLGAYSIRAATLSNTDQCLYLLAMLHSGIYVSRPSEKFSLLGQCPPSIMVVTSLNCFCSEVRLHHLRSADRWYATTSFETGNAFSKIPTIPALQTSFSPIRITLLNILFALFCEKRAWAADCKDFHRLSPIQLVLIHLR